MNAAKDIFSYRQEGRGAPRRPVKIRRSLLLDARADLLVYGNA